MAKKKKQRGPKPDNLKLEGDWQEAVKTAIKKKKPKNGWPDKQKEK